MGPVRGRFAPSHHRDQETGAEAHQRDQMDPLRRLAVRGRRGRELRCPRAGGAEILVAVPQRDAYAPPASRGDALQKRRRGFPVEDPQPGVCVPDLSRWMEGRIAGTNSSQEGAVTGRSVPADLVSSGSRQPREKAEISTTTATIFSATRSEEELDQGSRVVEEEGSTGEVGESSGRRRGQIDAAHRDRSRG